MTTLSHQFNPARYCVQCAHCHQPLEFGEYYCAVGTPSAPDLVTGKERRPFAQIERANADKCGPLARNFTAKEGA